MRRTTIRRLIVALAGLALVGGTAGAAGAAPPATGTGPTTNVVGGEPSPKGAWPTQAALLLPGVEDAYDAQFCAGTLVAARWVLTAAHCVESATGGVIDPAEVEVAVGFSRLRDIATADRVTVTAVVSHPRYRWDQEWSAGRFDAALLRLDTALPGPYADLAGPRQDGAWGPGTVATVVGWGTTEFGTPNYAYVLRQAEVPVVADRTCKQIYPELNGPSTLCAGWLGTGGRDACQGDSGGPLWVSINGRWRQIGIVSGGIGCAGPDHPGTYGDVRGLHDWIIGVIR